MTECKHEWGQKRKVVRDNEYTGGIYRRCKKCGEKKMESWG